MPRSMLLLTALIGLLPMLGAVDASATLLTRAELEALAESAPSGPYTLQTDSFSLRSRVPDNPELTCHVVSAFQADGSPAPRARQAVLYLQHPRERFFQEPKNPKHPGFFRRIAQESGFTVFGVFFDHQDEQVFDLLKDKERSYLFHESGAYEALVDAWKALHDRLPALEDRILLVGNSGGGILCQRFAAYEPELVRGAAVMAGTMFLQMPNRGSIAEHNYLVLNTRSDPIARNNDMFHLYARREGARSLRWESMPEWGRRGGVMMYHCIDPHGFRLGMRFLEAVNDLGEGISRWPFAYDRDATQRVVSTEHLDWREVLGAERVGYAPSAAVCLELQARIPEPRREAIGRSGEWTVAHPPPRAETEAVVIVAYLEHDDQPLSIDSDVAVDRHNLREYDIMQAASAGLLAIDASDESRRIDDLVEALGRDDTYEDLPVVLAVFGGTTRDLRYAIPRRGIDRLCFGMKLEEWKRKALSDAWDSVDRADAGTDMVVFYQQGEDKEVKGAARALNKQMRKQGHAWIMQAIKDKDANWRHGRFIGQAIRRAKALARKRAETQD